ncbi:growth factor receptor-bound protein 7-like isoform X1 [Hemiscyllium ocellatum]|uniref:growth factor receptor-bound protein 7-like isoform X1 n=1 Tax=Hemiscyllium ocellatum TaxID=170820 RepID=UPI002966DDA0|nr:growth factor receptor-bound protein 7-like isoform X1 [Hemiscyllium ocellatum]
MTWTPTSSSITTTAKETDADMDFMALEQTVSTRLDNLYQAGGLQKDEAVTLPNGHLAMSQPAPWATSVVPRSQPVHIQVKRQLKEEELQTTSLPTIPNPFPELCSLSNSPNLSNEFKPPASGGTRVITIFSEDGMKRSLEVTAAVKARDVCHILVERNRCLDEGNWTLVEAHPNIALERCLEDHESLIEVQKSWLINSGSRFIFRKHYAKYEFFRNPEPFFPVHLVAGTLDANAGVSHSQLIQNFLNAQNCPEIQGFLHVKDKGKKTWRRLYFFLRRSGLYYSTKGMSKEPRHLQYFADVNESNIYTVTNRKMYNTPTDFGFCIKFHRSDNGRSDLGVLCSDDEQSRTCWMTAFRLFKLGEQLCLNYQIMQQKKKPQSWIQPSIMTNVSESCLVPMDFSGCTGRVIQNAKEASSVAEEEAQAWRKKGVQRHSLPSPCQGSVLSAAIHSSQPWFHGRISREEAHRLIIQHGHIDGVFLIRESQRTPKGFVLTLSHHHKTKHFLVVPCEEDGQTYLTVDTGQTKFTDLIQLVDFYQINRGVLPCSLKHYCTRVSL